jgi:hypothetical protein
MASSATTSITCWWADDDEDDSDIAESWIPDEDGYIIRVLASRITHGGGSADKKTDNQHMDLRAAPWWALPDHLREPSVGVPLERLALGFVAL